MLIKTELIRIDGGTQQRAEINYDVVTEYATAMTDGVTLPPVAVFFDGSVNWLVDGFHRWHAARKAGFLDIEANVKNGSQRDAVLWSLGANHSHGLQRTNADKKKAVMTALNDLEWRLLANTDIAKLCAVSEITVRRAKDEIVGKAPTGSTLSNSSDKTLQQSKKKDEVQKEKAEPAKTNPAPIEPNNVPAYDDDGAPTDYNELDQLRDENNELRDTIADLCARLSAYGDADMPPLFEMHAELEKENKNLKINLEAVTRSRDSMMNEKAEMMRQIQYWKKQAGVK